MGESSLTAIFAKSRMGGLYIGVEEPLDDDPYDDPYDEPTVFHRLPDDISESDLLRELRRAQQTGEIDPQYKKHMPYQYGGSSGPLFYLMRRNNDGVQYHPGRGLIAIRERWAKQMGLPKPQVTEAELDAAEEAENNLEDKARRN